MRTILFVPVIFLFAAVHSADAACVIHAFSATPTAVNSGQMSSLSWTTTGCTTASISSIGSVATSGTSPTPPINAPTTFTLTASGGNTVTASTTVNTINSQIQCVIDTFTAIPGMIPTGQTSLLKWTTHNCQSATINQGIGAAIPVSSGNHSTPNLAVTTAYTITAVGINNTAVAQVAVVVVPPCIITSFNANPATIPSGTSSTLYWTTSNCNSASINQGIGAVAINGNTPTPNLTQNTTYTLTAVGPLNTANANTTVTVTPPLCVSNTWTQKASFGGTARIETIGFSIGTKGYIGTGYDASFTLVQDFWEYDQVTNTWSQKANFGGGVRFGGIAFAVGGKGYLGTGWDGSNDRKDIWEYDPIANNWTQKADLGVSGRKYGVGFNIGSKGYAGTGYISGVKQKDFWEFDPVGNTWTQKADFGGTARIDAVGFAIGTKGYLGMGHDGVKKKDFWQYDPVGNAWTQKADFGGTARVEPAVFAIGNKGYIGAGHDGAYKKDFWQYDSVANSWTQKADFGGGLRQDGVGFAIGSFGYMGMGANNNVYFNDFWEYCP